MSDLAEQFGSRESGELIRASDWNGLIDAIEGRFAALEAQLGERLSTLEGALSAVEGRVDAVAADLEPLAELAASLRARYRRVDLAAARSAFAIGERGEIVARVTGVDGATLDLSNASTRPWIDFVTVWGALRAAPGFTSRGGASDRTITVQVNADGEARVLLRAEHAEAFADEQEQEVDAVLQTSVGNQTVADRILTAATPGSSSVSEAYAAVSSAYDRTDTAVMRNYLDAYYLRNPAQSFTYLNSIFALNWRDYHATVLAFVKPDDTPGTSDGAQATGAIRVTFRDWVYPWIFTHYLPPQEPRIADYRSRFGVHLGDAYEQAVDGLFEVVNEHAIDRGVIGMYQELAAARRALVTMPAEAAPSYLPGLIKTVNGGLQVQQRLAYSQSVTPLIAHDVGAGIAFGSAAAEGQIAAGREIAEARKDFDQKFAVSETRIIDSVRAENQRFSNDLLRDDGPVRRAENLAVAASNEVTKVNSELQNRATVELVGQLLNARTDG